MMVVLVVLGGSNLIDGSGPGSLFTAGNFFEVLRNPTAETVQQLITAISPDTHNYLLFAEAGTGYLPLEYIMLNFAVVSDDQRGHYKKLFKVFLQNFEVSKLGQLKKPNPLPQELVDIMSEYSKELNDRAHDAVVKKNRRELKAVVERAPFVLTDINPTTKKSLAREVLDGWTKNDSSKSLKVFTYIVKEKPECLVSKADPESSAQEIMNHAFTEACKAIVEKDIRALDKVVKLYPFLLVLQNPQSHSTLLHEAFNSFSQKDPRTVQIFSYLIRAGADYRLKTGIQQDGASVEELVLQDGCLSSVLFTQEIESLKLSSLKAQLAPLAKDVKKSVQPFIDQIAPYKGHIAVGSIILFVVGYLLKPQSSLKKNRQHSSMIQVGQLQ